MIRAAVLTVAVALAVAPVAHADNVTYLQRLRPLLTTDAQVATDGQLLKLGYAACATMKARINAGDSMAQARQRSDQAVFGAAVQLGLPITTADGMNITEESEANLC
jgi:hypothetical protein